MVVDEDFECWFWRVWRLWGVIKWDSPMPYEGIGESTAKFQTGVPLSGGLDPGYVIQGV